MVERIKTVEFDPSGGWIARSPFNGRELGGEGFRWNSRSVARTVVEEERLFPNHFERCRNSSETK